MANEDKKDFRPLPIKKALRNMAETKCTLPRQSTMTR